MTESINDITDAQWEELAQESQLSGAELKALVIAEVPKAEEGLLAGAEAPATTGELVTKGPCQITPFQAGIWKIIACKGEIRLCGPKDAWSGEIEVTFLLADVPVFTKKYRLGKDGAEVKDSFSLIAVRADYAVGIRTDGWCYYIKGSFGYLTFTGWKDHPVNKTIFCFGDIF